MLVYSLAGDSDALQGRRAALQLGKAPSCLDSDIYGRLGSRASKARATRVGKHNLPVNKLLRTGIQVTRDSDNFNRDLKFNLP